MSSTGNRGEGLHTTDLKDYVEKIRLTMMYKRVVIAANPQKSRIWAEKTLKKKRE